MSRPLSAAAKLEMITVSVRPEQIGRLRYLSRLTRVPWSEFARQALDLWLSTKGREIERKALGEQDWYEFAFTAQR